ncbi:suppressor of IKBKE 1 [Phyllostomus discolor]|uniref:Suppressor of IKBKE 1 n=1 Tax=Phyllostomus discolor TaxID=89673 RepID=A0A834DD86_9CHIR|nr:suppressor of IKBKE 1 [Phyllostomus discolor]
MSCTIEKILTDAKTLLERLREHDAAAESLVDQSAALHRRVAAMREAGTALPEQEIESQIDRICEMGEVMRKAVQVDDDQFCKVQEKLAQLELENKELRELLSISSESLQVRKENSVDTASQAIK